MKDCKTILLLLLVLVVAACTDRGTDDGATTSDTDGRHSSLYNQGATSACWIYAMLTCIEKEQQLTGDSIPLSRQWLLARAMEEQTMCRYLMLQRGETPPFTADPRNAVITRGVGPEVIRLINAYGLVPYSHEKTHIISDNVTGRRLTQMAGTAVSADQLRERMADILPRFTVSLRGTFFLYSMQYTPQQFAESIMYRQHWHFYASEPQHPWGEDFALEIRDNYRYHQYTNLPMDSLEQRVIRSLRAGHPVYWEYGKIGRESAHAMAIIKIVKGKDGKDRLLCQNSYGLDWGNHGRCAVSMEYFRKHTCNVGLTEEQ